MVICCSGGGGCALLVYSAENCIAGCDAKAYFDPGSYGPEHSQVTAGPLNVCCSKWGSVSVFPFSLTYFRSPPSSLAFQS